MDLYETFHTIFLFCIGICITGMLWAIFMMFKDRYEVSPPSTPVPQLPKEDIKCL